MRMRVTGRTMKFIDESKPQFEEVRDEFCAQNPYPASDEEICKWTPEQYKQWQTTGRKPADEQACASNAAAERFSLASDRLRGIDNGRPSESELSNMKPGERFKAASDARNRLNPNYQQDARLRRR
jgi:hypothetical protein